MKLKKINHIGVVVEDIKEAKERYSKIYGIKKWYELVNSSPLDLYYHGEKRNCEVTLYFGGKGFTKIELIQTKGDDNIYTEFLKRNGEGIHHIMYNVKNLKKAIEYYESIGMKVFQQATFKSAGANIAYAYMGFDEKGVIFEFIETTIAMGLKKGDLPGEVGALGVLTGNYKKLK